MWGLRLSLTLAILTAVIGGCAGKQMACLEVFGEGPETVLASLPIEPGAPFTLEFINSIYLAPVRETLVFDPSEGASIVLVESPSDGVFEYYGLEPDGTGRVRMNRRVGDIKLRSHDYGNHRITVGGQVIRLNGIVPNGEPIFVRIKVREECGM